jgi:activator of 2-hydroxyglutaryl-CoA dehydratase
VINDKCAAGISRFIEVMVQALGLRIEEVVPAALAGKNHREISSTCTMEMISLRAQGRKREDLIAGVLKSITKSLALWHPGLGQLRN